MTQHGEVARRAIQTQHELVARRAKAIKLTDVLIAHGADFETAAALPPQGRTMVAQLAGCREASDTTWALVVEMVQADALWGSKFFAKTLNIPGPRY